MKAFTGMEHLLVCPNGHSERKSELEARVVRATKPQCGKCGTYEGTQERALFTSTYVHCAKCDAAPTEQPSTNITTKWLGVSGRAFIGDDPPREYYFSFGVGAIEYVFSLNKQTGTYFRKGEGHTTEATAAQLESSGYKPRW